MADNTYHYQRRTPIDRSLRASDEDRNAVGEILRRQHAAGRIDTEEFSERFGRCLEAKTYAELDALIADLPFGERVQGEGASAGTGVAAGWARPRLWRLPAVAWVALVVAAVALSHGQVFWLAFPLFFFFVFRPFVWRGGWGRGRGWGSGGPGQWSCRPGYTRQGTTTV